MLANRMQMLLAQCSGNSQHDVQVQELQERQEAIERSITGSLEKLQTLEQETAQEEKKVFALTAERMEVNAALQAQTAENKATSSEVLDVQAELAAVKDETAAQKKAFITECRALDDTMRRLKETHPGSSFV
ncbi:hypothetical protein COCOBI_04-5480 [Coccomyxa sp. Obi]|nr:hypothetical protein COCOBI_04-5480 [Coccomyxa sp. Obi]